VLGCNRTLHGGPLKTEGSRRPLPLADFVVELLRSHRARQAESRLALGGEWANPELVFTTAGGEPLDSGCVRRSFQRFLRQKGLRVIRFHDLRHSAATLLLAKGIQPHIATRYLGHSQIGTTLAIYAHTTNQMLKDAAVTLGDALSAKEA